MGISDLEEAALETVVIKEKYPWQKPLSAVSLTYRCNTWLTSSLRTLMLADTIILKM